MSLKNMNMIDKIYEAAFVPEMWPDLLQELAAFVDGEGAMLFTTDLQNVSRWTASESVHQVMIDWIDGGWQAKTRRTHKLVSLRHAGFITESDVFSPEELETDPEHVEFLNPRGLGLSAGTFIPMPTGDVVVYSIERAKHLPGMSRAELDRLDAIRPHLARAGTIAVRLGMERAKSAAEAFSVIGLPAAALGPTGRLIAANTLFEALIPEIFEDRAARLVLADKAADQLLARGLTTGRRAQALCSIPVAAKHGHPPYVVHLLAIAGNAHDIFSRVAWMCVVMPIIPGKVPGAEVLQALFDLTAAEARVAGAVGNAVTLEALAENLGLSRETVRSQLKAVLAKTGLKRQSELTALLAGKTLPEPGARRTGTRSAKWRRARTTVRTLSLIR
jgi:DNA-binding CsgD family transcriptional regulator